MNFLIVFFFNTLQLLIEKQKYLIGKYSEHKYLGY